MGLESSDCRQRLETYARLSEQCSVSKSHQNAVGYLLRQFKASDSSHRVLDGVLRDLQANDRSLRVAATRLVCHAVYENLLMQAFMQGLENGGFSVGWVHIFSIPSRYQVQQQTTTTRTHQEFLRAIVQGQYASVYEPVSRYYADDCQSFLPRWWQFPAPYQNPIDDGSLAAVPDPEEHLVGFFLVPRQTQFPEATDQDLVQALDVSDVDRLRHLKELFDAVASKENVEITVLIETIETHKTELQWLLKATASYEPEVLVQSIAGDRISTLITWHQVFTHCCAQLHGEKLREVFGSPVYESLLLMFRTLSFRSEPPFAWEPVLVGSVLSQPEFPAKLKRHIRRLSLGRYDLKVDEAGCLKQPWRYLLDLTLEAVSPVSWPLFLARWRLKAADCGHHDTLRRPPTPHKVLSVPDMRKSIVSMDLRSVRDLGQLETQLPLLCRSIASLRMVETSAPVNEEADEDSPWDEGDSEPVESCAQCRHHEDFRKGTLNRRSLEELNTLCQIRSQARLEAKRHALEQITSSKIRYLSSFCAGYCFESN